MGVEIHYEVVRYRISCGNLSIQLASGLHYCFSHLLELNVYVILEARTFS